jgi:hypothetical protein
MYKYFKTFLIFFAVWFVASLLNGLISGTAIAMLDSASYNTASENMSLAFVCSYIISIPFVGLVWLVTVIAQAHGSKGTRLFQTILKSTLILSLSAAFFFINTLGNEFNHSKFIVGLSIVVTAVSSVLFFHQQFKSSE